MIAVLLFMLLDLIYIWHSCYTKLSQFTAILYDQYHGSEHLLKNRLIL
jgi:hypothetical protein